MRWQIDLKHVAAHVFLLETQTRLHGNADEQVPHSFNGYNNCSVLIILGGAKSQE